MSDSVIALNIRKYIKESGLKQKAVAEKAGYDQKIFSNMLTGRKTITDKDIIPIAKALNLTPNDLFGINNTP